MSRIVETVCPLDCPDSCSLSVTVEAGRIEAVRAGTGNSDTSGFICRKVSRFGERVHHPDRILQPLRRIGAKGEGRFEPISWSQALDEIVANFRRVASEHGAEAILPYAYGGSNGLLSDSFVDELLFARLGASRLDRTLCAAAATAVNQAMYGRMPGCAYADVPKAKAILLWGANPKASNIHLVPRLKEARAAGAFVASVDPIRHFSAQEIDLHLPIRPGTDLPVALALAQWAEARGHLASAFLAEHAEGLETLLAAARPWTLERAAQVAGVKIRDLEALAEGYAAASPALLRIGWGLERNRNGGQAFAAVLALPSLYGKFGLAGGGYLASNGRDSRLDTAKSLGVSTEELDGAPRRTVNMTQLGDWLVNGPATENQNGPPIQALFVYNANPVAMTPDQNQVLTGLARPDLFTVVFDQVMTDTAVWADIVLPATTFLEHHDLQPGYGTYGVGAIKPVIAAIGESRSNAQVFADLGRRLGFTDTAFQRSDEEFYRQAVAALHVGEEPGNATILGESGAFQKPHWPAAGAGPIQFVDVSPATPSGKVELAPSVLGARPYEYLEADSSFPLALLSPAGQDRLNSTLGELDRSEQTATLNPDDAAARGLQAGDLARVWNELGEIVCPVAISNRPRPGVVWMPKGIWRRHSRQGQTVNALCPSHVEPVAGQACYFDARVEVEAWAAATA